MNEQNSEKIIHDCAGMAIDTSCCTKRIPNAHEPGFASMTFPHMLRFRRVFNNVVDLNSIYDIYIDSDFKLLLYENDQPQFITTVSGNGDPVIIPAYPFTGNEPYSLPKKQPTPFPYFSPEDIRASKEINDLLTGAERDTEKAANIPASAVDDITESSGNDRSGDGEPIKINVTDTANDSAAKEKLTAANRNLADSDKKITESERESFSALTENIKESIDARTAKWNLGDSFNNEENLSEADDLFSQQNDIDAAQIDIAEDAPESEKVFPDTHITPEDGYDQGKADNSSVYFAKQLIKQPQNTPKLSMGNRMSVSVSEEDVHSKGKTSESKGVSAGDNENPVSDSASGKKRSASEETLSKESISSKGISQDINKNYMDIISSGAQLQLSEKIGIENKQLCLIEHPKTERSSKKKGEDNEIQPDDIFHSIANFCLVPLIIERHIYMDNAQTFIHTAVFSPVFPEGFRKIVINAEDIEKVGKTVRQSFPQLYYDPGLNSAPKYISTALSMMMSSMREKAIAHFYGWRCFDYGRFIYLNDNIDENPLFKSESGKSLMFDENIHQGTAFLYAYKMLKLSNDINKTLPLFLTAHLGVMYSFFEMAGYAPRFVLFLCGETGSLKTSISKIFFRLLTDGNNEIPANFNDTMTALEIKMGTTRDETFLVDDFHPSAMNYELTKMRSNLEKLIRFYGDGIGKGRGNIELKLREEFKPHSMCAVTGEYVHGTASSLQRLMIVNVDKNTYDRGLLKFYQDNPWLFRTHINFFITYLSQNSQRIIPYISSKFIEKRSFYTKYLTSKRLVDAAVCMDIMAEIILLFYANDCKLVHAMDIKPQLEIWKKCILNSVKESELLSNSREPVDMFCTVIANIARNESIRIPPSKKLFEENFDYAIGYYDFDKKIMYLKRDESYVEVVQYWERHGIPFNIKAIPLRRELLISGMLFGSVDGDTQKTSTVININGKPTRMLAFNLAKFSEKYGVFSSPPFPIVFK